MKMKNLLPLPFLLWAAALLGQDVTFENDALRATGSRCGLKTLENDATAYANRGYVFKDVPSALRNTSFFQTYGGEAAEISVTAKRDTAFLVATESREAEQLPKSWEYLCEDAFWYNDGGKTKMRIYRVSLKMGQTCKLPQVNWTGCIPLFTDTPEGWNPPRPRLNLTRMLYNNPGLLDDLAVGLWVWPVPVDYNGDGNVDLILSCEDTPYNGTYRFENTGENGLGNPPQSSTPVPCAAMPVFRRGERVSGGQINVQASFVDGTVRVLRQNAEYPDFANTGLSKPVALPLPGNVHKNNVRGNMWKYLDFDGDGALDIAVGTDDWKPYGWDDAYDENGVWKNDMTHGNVYIIRNEGTTAEPKYAAPYMLKTTDGNVIQTFGWPSPCFEDFDGDGDLDLLCGEFRDKFTYFQNVGTRTQPRYAPGVRPAADDGEEAHTDLCMITPVVYDWNRDGRPDILCGDEDGRVAYFENTGKFDGKKAPIFKTPLYFQQEAYELKAGALATPWCADLNGDGATDIITGTSAGYAVYFENLSAPGEEHPKWARPVYLKEGPDGKVMHINAVHNGSIQGPIEDKWGYTTLSVADWDGDGLLDIMWNSIWGKVKWFRNVGTKTEPKFAERRPVEAEWDGPQPRLAWGRLEPEGKALLTQWRTTPVMFDWNRDGMMDLCMLDHEGYFAFFERYRAEDGSLKLKAPQRIFCGTDGKPLRMNSGRAGGSGRRKMCICDWDGDGKFDLMFNSKNAEFWRQTRAEDGKFYFENRGNVDSRTLQGHSSSPTAADFNADGVPDLVIGGEDGRFYYLRNPGK